MGTRSMTHFADSAFRKTKQTNRFGYPIHQAIRRPKVEAKIFKHWDGYPGTMVPLIRTFFEAIKQTCKDGDTRFDDPTMLAARYVAFLGRMYEREQDFKTDEVTYFPMAFNSVRIMEEDAMDAEYRYTIWCSHPDRERGSLPLVKIETMDRDYDSDQPFYELLNGEFHDPTDWEILPTVLEQILEPR